VAYWSRGRSSWLLPASTSARRLRSSCGHRGLVGAHHRPPADAGDAHWTAFPRRCLHRAGVLNGAVLLTWSAWRLGWRAHDVALTLLDPLSSRLSEDLDSHRDPEVRRALEPLHTRRPHRSAVLAGAPQQERQQRTADPHPRVARVRRRRPVGVHRRPRPDDDTDTVRLFGTRRTTSAARPARHVVPHRRHTIDTDEGPASTGACSGWRVPSSIGDAIAADGQSADDRPPPPRPVRGCRIHGHRGRRAASATSSARGQGRHTHDSSSEPAGSTGSPSSPCSPGSVLAHSSSRSTVGANPLGDSPTALTTPTGPSQSSRSS